MFMRIALFVALVGAMFLFGVSVHAADFYEVAPPPPPVVVHPMPPAVVVHPVPPILVPVEPRCHTVRETSHDDILDTNDWVEHEICD
jgi:hypothetical protein